MGTGQRKSTKFQVGNKAAYKDIDYGLLDNLVAIFCTGEECAAVLNVDYDTLNARVKERYNMSFPDYFKLKSPKGKASLRRRQFEMARTNPALAIWLGKQYLGQRDQALIDQSKHETNITKVEIKISDDTAVPLTQQSRESIPSEGRL